MKMKRKVLKAIALMMTVAMPMGLAITEQMPEVPDGELDLSVMESPEGLEIDKGEGPDVELTEEMPAELDDTGLSLGDLTLVSEVTYRFIMDDQAYATQIAQVGEEILCPAAPEAPSGKVFAGWMLANGTPLFVDADEDGKIDPVIVRDYELGTEVCARAEFTDSSETEQPAEEAQPTEEQPAEEEQPADAQQPAEEVPTEEQSEEEVPTEAEPVKGEIDEAGPTGEEPVEEEPVDEEPTGAAPAEEEPVKEEASEQAPAEEAPVVEEPVEEEASEQAPAEEAPAVEEPVEEEASEQAPAEEAPVVEEPVEEEASEQAPAEEAPAVEEPVEEEAPEQAPVEEAQTALTQPVANALTYNGEAQPLVNVDGTWLYSLDGETYSEAVPTAVNAGEYTVYYKAAEADEPQVIAVTVAKADAIFTPPVAAVSE